jgi:hypothetical protein
MSSRVSCGHRHSRWAEFNPPFGGAATRYGHAFAARSVAAQLPVWAPKASWHHEILPKFPEIRSMCLPSTVGGSPKFRPHKQVREPPVKSAGRFFRKRLNISWRKTLE